MNNGSKTWMEQWRPRCVGLAGLLLLIPGAAWAAGGKAATQLVAVADTRGMAAGLSKWIADIYNSNLWLFGLLVVSSMALIGLVLGLTFDRLIGLLGLNLGKLDHHGQE